MFVADEAPLPGAGFRVTTRLVFLVAANWTIRGEEDDAPGPRPRSFSPFDQWCLQVKDGAGAPGGPSKAEPGAGSAGRGAAGATLTSTPGRLPSSLRGLSWTAGSSNQTARPRTLSTCWRSTRSPSPC